VVKDMNELTNSAHSKFLSCVRDVNSMCDDPETRFEYKPIVAIIPTKNRPDKLQRALDSMVEQTYQPKLTIVITDPGKKRTDETLDVLSRFSDDLKIKHITNNRTENLSGAVNSGLDFVAGSGYDMNNTYLAFLDDDDWWDRRYLENCMKYALETESDWVITGLIRHDEDHPGGVLQEVPTEIGVSDFLVTNPNVQGSNLFIRADKITSIGGFDEKLASTTDRDVCIRLLQSNDVRHSFLRNHLVHHDGSNNPDRLSYPGSPCKRAGLAVFYEKYSPIMSESQKEGFKKRAKDLFDIDLDGACP
jgi:glycosyltransferase involved in cell wall biosynthesis